MNTLLEEYRERCRTLSSINLHLPVINQIVRQWINDNGMKPIVAEFGMRLGDSTVALLAGEPAVLTSYDVCPIWDAIKLMSKICPDGTAFVFKEENTRETKPVKANILLIDSLHVGYQLSLELDRHADGVTDYIIFHDVTHFGLKDEVDPAIVDGGALLPLPYDYVPGLLPAILLFLEQNEEWGIHYYEPKDSHGLLIIRRKQTR